MLSKYLPNDLMNSPSFLKIYVEVLQKAILVIILTCLNKGFFSAIISTDPMA